VFNVHDILECCGFFECTWFYVLKCALDHEDSIKFTPAHYLLRLMRQNPHYFLDELMHLLKT
ncbi:hypothetical protein M405DRAFT_696446, partial [Rhizopogon salebrosus TDB-379]